MQANEKPAGGGAPPGSRTYTFLIYDGDSGEVVHGHKVLVLPHGQAPSEEEHRDEALKLAAEVTKRPKESLKVLSVEEHELQPGHIFRVDPASGSLEQHPLHG